LPPVSAAGAGAGSSFLTSAAGLAVSALGGGTTFFFVAAYVKRKLTGQQIDHSYISMAN
jgi:hypothetical protein